MPEQGNIDLIQKERPMIDPPQELILMRDQWIPSVEKMIPDVVDEEKRNELEKELEQIKSDFEDVKDADFHNEEVMKQVKAVYRRSEDLFGKISLSFEKEGDI